MRAAAAAGMALIGVLVSVLWRGRLSGDVRARPGPAGSGAAGSKTSRAEVPWWGLIPAAAAPVTLVAGWTVAAELQPRPYEVLDSTVSALAAVGSANRWVMTFAFALAGAAEVVTGLALRPAAAPGRLALMAGGAAGVLVAASPQHAGGSLTHAVWAVVGFSALVAWPGGAWRRGAGVPWGLRPVVSVSAAAILLGLLAWFGVELVAGGGHVGLAERVMGVAQASWPLVVTLSCRLSLPTSGHHRHRAGREPGRPVRPADRWPAGRPPPPFPAGRRGLVLPAAGTGTAAGVRPAVGVRGLGRHRCRPRRRRSRSWRRRRHPASPQAH